MNNQDNNLFPIFLIAGSMIVIGTIGTIYGIIKGIISIFS